MPGLMIFSATLRRTGRGLLGHEDDAHAAFADLLEQLVGADDVAGAFSDRRGCRYVPSIQFRRGGASRKLPACSMATSKCLDASHEDRVFPRTTSSRYALLAPRSTRSQRLLGRSDVHSMESRIGTRLKPLDHQCEFHAASHATESGQDNIAHLFSATPDSWCSQLERKSSVGRRFSAMIPTSVRACSIVSPAK